MATSLCGFQLSISSSVSHALASPATDFGFAFANCANFSPTLSVTPWMSKLALPPLFIGCWGLDRYGQWLVIGLVLLHLGATVYYQLRKKHNLVRPMLTGDKPLGAEVPASADGAANRMLAALLVAGCAALVAWLVSLGA